MSYRDQENQALLRRGVEALEVIAKGFSKNNDPLVEIVPCVDCSYLRRDDLTCKVKCGLYNHEVSPTDFCSRGCRDSHVKV